MTATLVERVGARATIRLTPSRLGRWFGAREEVCELVANSANDPSGQIDRDADGEIRWRFAGTGRRVTRNGGDGCILDALERQVIEIPSAFARE